MNAPLDLYIAAAIPRAGGRLTDAQHADYLSAFRANPDLVSSARVELKRLSQTRGGTPLIDCCHISKIRHATLARMLATFDGKDSPRE